MDRDPRVLKAEWPGSTFFVHGSWVIVSTAAAGADVDAAVAFVECQLQNSVLVIFIILYSVQSVRQVCLITNNGFTFN